MFKFFEKREPVMNPVEDRQLAKGESLEAVGPEPEGYDLPKAPYSSETQEKLDALYKEREAKEQEEAVKWEEQQPLHSYENIEEKFDKISETEEQQREKERRGMGIKFDERARGGNSKPIEKDYRNGIDLEDLAA